MSTFILSWQVFAGFRSPVFLFDIHIYLPGLQFTGSPVSAAKRLQFSMELGPIRDHELFGQLPDVILPMFWAEEGASLNKTWTNQLKYQLFL